MAAALCAALAWSQGAAAQTQADGFPNNTVKIVVPTAPGGPLDVLGRLITPRLRDAWSQPVIIENRPGRRADDRRQCGRQVGAGRLHAAAEQRWPGHHQSEPLQPDALRPEEGTGARHDGGGRALRPGRQRDNVPAKTVAEFIALAKASPGKINYASGGNTSRLAAELFRLSAGIEIVNVPYNGSGQAILGVVGGEVHMMIDGITSSLPHVLSGKLRALGVGTKGRIKELPDIPAVAETMPGYIGTTWLGLFAPAGTPPDDRQQDPVDVRQGLAGTGVARAIGGSGHVSGGQHAGGVCGLSRRRHAAMGAGDPGREDSKAGMTTARTRPLA